MRQTSAVAKGATCLVLSFQDILYSLQVQIHVKRRFSIPYCPNKHHQRCIITSSLRHSKHYNRLWLRTITSWVGKRSSRLKRAAPLICLLGKQLEENHTRLPKRCVSCRLSQQRRDFRMRAGIRREKQECC